MENTYCKLEIFIPETHLEALQRALQEVDAGHIGNYDCCLSYSPVTGCWRPLKGAAPYLGSVGEISRDLKKRGMKYMGPVTVYSHLQACGLINDHKKDCD